MVNTIQANKIKNAFINVIDTWGSDITLTPPASTTYDAWRKPIVVDGTAVDTVGVLDGNIVARMQLQSLGRLKDGEMRLILKGDETIDETYKITIDSKDYNIMSIDDTKAANVTIVYQLIIGEKRV